MEQSRRSDKPFFAHLAFTTAHLPIQAPGGLAERYYEQYADKWQIQDVRTDWNPQKELGH